MSKIRSRSCSCSVVFSGIVADRARADDQAAFDHKDDVVYGRKFGTALTMDVFTPKANANGAAVIWVVSGGWFSAHEAINPGFIDELLKRGTRSSPSSTAASPGSRFPRSSRT